METRQRSLSVGNETCWKNRHLQKQPTQQQLLWHTEQQLHHSGADIVDGVQLRNPLKGSKSSTGAHKRNSAECWKTALNRNDRSYKYYKGEYGKESFVFSAEWVSILCLNFLF